MTARPKVQGRLPVTPSTAVATMAVLGGLAAVVGVPVAFGPATGRPVANAVARPRLRRLATGANETFRRALHVAVASLVGVLGPAPTVVGRHSPRAAVQEVVRVRRLPTSVPSIRPASRPTLGGASTPASDRRRPVGVVGLATVRPTQVAVGPARDVLPVVPQVPGPGAANAVLRARVVGAQVVLLGPAARRVMDGETAVGPRALPVRLPTPAVHPLRPSPTRLDALQGRPAWVQEALRVTVLRPAPATGATNVVSQSGTDLVLWSSPTTWQTTSSGKKNKNKHEGVQS